MLVDDLPRLIAYSLTITLVVELALAAILRVRNLNGLLTVALSNVMTNPSLVCFSYSAGILFGQTAYLIVLAVCECGVVFAEGMVYLVLLKEKRRPFLFSLILNAASFAVGAIVFYFLPL